MMTALDGNMSLANLLIAATVNSVLPVTGLHGGDVLDAVLLGGVGRMLGYCSGLADGTVQLYKQADADGLVVIRR